MEFAHILSFCKKWCGSAENMVMMMMMKKRKRLYHTNVTFETVKKTSHLLLYSMLKVMYRNVLHVISFVRMYSNCCEAQNVTFYSGMSTCQCNKPHLHIIENHKHADIFRREPYIGFKSLLSHCSTVSQWLPCFLCRYRATEFKKHIFEIVV
jgi:hypothetical protein